MTNEKLFALLSDLDGDAVAEAGELLTARPRPALLKWGALAACLLLAAGIAAFALRPAPSAETPAPEPTLAAPRIEAEPGRFDNEPRSDAPRPAEVPAEPEVVPPEPEAPPAETVGGVTVPPVEVPDSGDLSMMDMIGLVVYHGGVYTQAESYWAGDAERVDALTGEYLGEVKGSISEWSGPEDYAQEFVGSVGGPLYTVRGYDEDFRLCVRVETQDENGEPALWIEYLERLNGVTLTRGAELFEDRLHLRENFASLQWQSHEDWNYHLGGLHDADLDPALWGAFLDELDAGLFVDMWDPEHDYLEGQPGSNIFSSPGQVHLILTQTDGTLLRLRLIEGGYVRYDGGTGWLFVRIPGETFDAVYKACGG